MPVQPRCRSEVGIGLDITDELMSAAVEIVAMAGRLAAQRFNEGSPVRIKADGSQVTSADVEVEELIRTLIAARFPGDGVVCEDQGETAGTSGRRWIIDPIDGTTYFAQRIPTGTARSWQVTGISTTACWNLSRACRAEPNSSR